MNEYNTIHSRLTSKNKITLEEKVNESMFIRSKQFQMYFEDILPIIQLDKENLNSVIVFEFYHSYISFFWCIESSQIM